MSVIAVGLIAGAAATAYGAYESNKTAKKAQESELGFAQRQYDDWQQIYGPIQENLSSFYSSLNADTFAAAGIESLETDFTNTMTRMQESFAQRGIDTSGISAGIERSNSIDLAKAKSEVRRNAPLQVAQMQQGFLQVGMGNNPSNNMQQTLSNNANRAYANSQQANAAFGQSVGQLVNYGINQYGSNTTALDSNTMAGSPYIDYNTGVV